MTKRKRKNIALRVNEIADAYALETLYHEIKDEFKDDNVYFSPSYGWQAVKDILRKYPQIPNYESGLYSSKPDLVIQAHSDRTEDLSRYERGPFRTLAIDISILKACKNLPTPRKCEQIKQEYDLKNKEKPLAVLGMANSVEKFIEPQKKLVQKIGQHAHIAVSDSFKMLQRSWDLNEEELKNLTEISGHGHLAGLYAVADLAFCANNLIKSRGRLNNFYEQAQGGPIFFIPSENTKQYGYNKLVDMELIRPCSNLDDIMGQSQSYIEEFKGNPKKMKNQHRRKWLAHQKKTRAKFMPQISEHIKYLLGSGKAKKMFTFIHPDSDWCDIISHESTTELYTCSEQLGVVA